MAVLVNDNEIVLTGTVGESYWGDGFTAVEVITALAKVGRDTDIVVRLNSGGGIATEGAAIHAALSAHKGNVDLVVEGIAASAASVIAMAGDKISMTLGSVMMIHDASTFAWGDAAELTKAVSALDTLSNAYASIYADRTGKSAAEMRDLMKAETWLTADEAVATGFADDAASADNDNEPAEASAFAYAPHQHAPERFVALAGEQPGIGNVKEVVPSTQGDHHDGNEPGGPDPSRCNRLRQDRRRYPGAHQGNSQPRGSRWP